MSGGDVAVWRAGCRGRHDLAVLDRGESAEVLDVDPLARVVALGQRVHQPDLAGGPVVRLDIDRVAGVPAVGERPAPAREVGRQPGVLTDEHRAAAVIEPVEELPPRHGVAVARREAHPDAGHGRDPAGEVVQARATLLVVRRAPEDALADADAAVGPLVDEHRPGRPDAVLLHLPDALGDVLARRRRRRAGRVDRPDGRGDSQPGEQDQPQQEAREEAQVARAACQVVGVLGHRPIVSARVARSHRPTGRIATVRSAHRSDARGGRQDGQSGLVDGRRAGRSPASIDPAAISRWPSQARAPEPGRLAPAT